MNGDIISSLREFLVERRVSATKMRTFDPVLHAGCIDPNGLIHEPYDYSVTESVVVPAVVPAAGAPTLVATFSENVGSRRNHANLFVSVDANPADVDYVLMQASGEIYDDVGTQRWFDNALAVAMLWNFFGAIPAGVELELHLSNNDALVDINFLRADMTFF